MEQNPNIVSCVPRIWGMGKRSRVGERFKTLGPDLVKLSMVWE